MNHTFNVGIAIDHGVEAAILIENLAFWIAKNKANNKNFFDGHYWTYNSAKAFSKLFPYWSNFKIQRLLVQLEAKGIIQSANYNKVNYDRTKWYAIVDESIMQIYTIHYAKLQNGECKTAQPIPDINTDNKTDNKTDKYIPPIPAELLFEWMLHRKRKPVTERVIKTIEAEASKLGWSLLQAIECCCANSWQGFKAEWVNKPNKIDDRAGAVQAIFGRQIIEKDITNEITPF
jgi:hypothetical protein